MFQAWLFLLSIIGCITLGVIATRRIQLRRKLKKESERERLREEAEHLKRAEERETLFRKEILEELGEGKMDSSEIQNSLIRADMYMNREEYDKAEALYISVMASDKNNEEAYLRLAYIYLISEKYRKAEALYYHLTKMFPGNAVLLNNLGLVLFKQQKCQEAVDIYKQAIELEPENPERYSNLGRVFFSLADFVLAEQHFQKALALATNNIEYLILLAETNQALGNDQQTYTYYEQIRSLNPEHPYVQEPSNVALHSPKNLG